MVKPHSISLIRQQLRIDVLRIKEEIVNLIGFFFCSSILILIGIDRLDFLNLYMLLTYVRITNQPPTLLLLLLVNFPFQMEYKFFSNKFQSTHCKLNFRNFNQTLQSENYHFNLKISFLLKALFTTQQNTITNQSLQNCSALPSPSNNFRF